MLHESYRPAPRRGDRIEVQVLAGRGLEAEWIRHEREEGGDHRLRVLGGAATARGHDLFEAWTALDAAMADEDRPLACCGSCRYFQVTGASRQMSGGEKGYCLLLARTHGRSRQDVVSVFGRCDCFARRDDESPHYGGDTREGCR